MLQRFVLTLSLLMPCLVASSRCWAEVTAHDEIRIKGKDEYKLKRDGGEWKLHGPGDYKRTLKPEGSEWALVGDDHKVRLRTRHEKDSVLRVVDAAGATVHELRRTDEGFALHGPDGAMLWRVKRKVDKFNVYDASAVRRFHGKKKEDGISIHDDKDAQLWKLKGLPSLDDAEAFGLPIDLGEIALLFAAGHGR